MVDTNTNTTIEKNTGLKKTNGQFKVFRIKSPVKEYTQNTGRGSKNTLLWESSTWDLVEVSRIYDVDGYFRRACEAKKTLFLKEGFDFLSSNPNRASYIYKRFEQIERVSNIPFHDLIIGTIDSLMRTRNAFWVKVRNPNASGGKVRSVSDKKTLNPVAGYYLMPVESVRFKKDEYGTIKSYEQDIYGKNNKEFKPEDVIHFSFNKRAGFEFGTPDVIPIKDDIKALRNIEQQVELLIHQHLFPLFHYQVGTDDAPAEANPDGIDEVKRVKLEVAEMPSDGCWVTPERHKITAVQTSQPPIAVEKVIEHYKNRIYVGLGVSAVDMGETGSSSRSTASQLSKNLINNVKFDQIAFGAQFYSYVIQELLLESTFPEETLFSKENKVTLKFREIDLEAKQAKDNHYVDMFLKNAITMDEMRLAIGKEPFIGSGFPGASGDYLNTYYALFDREKVVLQSLDEQGTPTSKEESRSRSVLNYSKAGGSSSENKSISNKNQPQNQHGTRSSAKIVKDFYKSVEKIKNNIISNIDNIDNIVNNNICNIKDELISKCKYLFTQGILDINCLPIDVSKNNINLDIEDYINKNITQISNNIIELLNNNIFNDKYLLYQNKLIINSVFNILSDSMVNFINCTLEKSYNYGLYLGIKSINNTVIINNDNCSYCNDNILYNDSSDIMYYEMFPLNNKCNCHIKRK